MSIQETALYGDLVLYLRDRAAELLADERGDVEGERERLDALIGEWFFAPQGRLHGCAPRDLIWAEQRGESNPVHPEHLDEFFFDDCPICRAELEEVKAALEAGQDPGWHWYYDDGGLPLIARYDPEGWDACWAEDDAFDEPPVGGDQTRDGGFPAAAEYAPLPSEVHRVTPDEFVDRLRQPWLDPMLHRAAQVLADCLDVPERSLVGVEYRPVSYEEALSLLVGLHDQGVDVEMLLAQIDAFPYQNVALDWLSWPAENAALLVKAIDDGMAGDDREELARLRHHRDFVFALSQLMPLGAQLWLRGWLDAVTHGVLARAFSRDDPES